MASTLWTKLSHLKQGYALRDKDTPDFKFLHSLLKKCGKSEPPKQAQEFSQSEFASILRLCHERSSDPRFLLMGTVAIVGTFGMYRNAEIWQFTTDMVHEDKLGFWLDYVGTSKNVPVGMQMRKFIPHQMLPHDGQVNPQPAKILGMYLQCLEQQLGPNYSGPLFMTLRNEKFIKVRMGVNKLAEISKRLASEIGVDLSGRTGHVWRATGASLLAAGGAQDGEIMRAGGWKSAAAARRYIRKSDLTSINVSTSFFKLFLFLTTVNDCIAPSLFIYLGKSLMCCVGFPL